MRATLAALLLVTASLGSLPAQAEYIPCPPGVPNPFAPGSLTHAIVSTANRAADETFGASGACHHANLPLPPPTPGPPACQLSDSEDIAARLAACGNVIAGAVSSTVDDIQSCQSLIGYAACQIIFMALDFLWPTIIVLRLTIEFLNENCDRFIGLNPVCSGFTSPV